MPLTLKTWIDKTCARPGVESRCSIAFELEASGDGAEGKIRAPSRTILALDVSYSMAGEPLDQVIRSVDRLLETFGPDDEIGIVAFSQNATRVVDPIKVDANGKRLVRSRCARLKAESGTNIEAGLNLAASLHETTPSGMRRGVVLLSDGAPNVGAHTEDALREVVRKHRAPSTKESVSFFSLGYGHDHCESILAAIGDAGGGGYEFVADPTACMRAFARALGAQGDVVASAIELVIAPADGIELERFVGREDTRFSSDGIIVSLADMISGGRRLVVAELKLRAPPRARFLIDVARAKVRWREPQTNTPSKPSSSGVVQKEFCELTSEASIEIAEREPAIVAEASRLILLVRADQAREEARKLADRGQFAAAASVIRSLMKEIERVPNWIVNDGTPLAEAYELLVDEVMVFERKPDPEQYSRFKKSTMTVRLSASAGPNSARDRGPESQKLIEHAAGDCPEAWLLAITGAGGKHMLHEECIIGRTNDADICVTSPSVSRRHAEVFANAGEYWIADLGSTNPTIVNGKPLGRAPHKLSVGDVVRVGDVELRYEEAPKVTH